jgi:hypothetical protein
MKNELAAYVRQAPAGFGHSTAREYLQARMLQHIGLSGQMTSLAFMGGTALRFLYAVPRYSEDLEFTLEANREGYAFDEQGEDRGCAVPGTAARSRPAGTRDVRTAVGGLRARTHVAVHPKGARSSNWRTLAWERLAADADWREGERRRRAFRSARGRRGARVGCGGPYGADRGVSSAQSVARRYSTAS